MGLLGALLLLAGAQGPWLEFPLSSTLYTADFASPWPVPGIASLKVLLILIGLVAGLGWLLGMRLLSLLAGMAALALLAAFFCTWSIQEQWLIRFLSESDQRIAIDEFLSYYYWPNNNPEPTTKLVKEFRYLHEQAQVFWYASGWGWVLCLTGAVLVLLDNLFSTPVSGASSFTVLVVTGMLLVIILFPLGQGEFKQREGDDLLASGQPREAIAAYTTALHLNPVLRHSGRFLIKASRAFFQLEGEGSPLASLYLGNYQDRWVVGEPLSIPAKQRLVRSNRSLMKGLNVDYPDLSLQTAVLHQTGREYIKGLVLEGLGAYANGELSVSSDLFQKALAMDPQQLHTGFYLAHVQRELGLFDDAIATLEVLVGRVKHKSVRADLLCTIGDVQTSAQRPLLARQAYTQCLENDSLFNYRAVVDLGGT
jgi:tetratricopeptide (TPR) repeat protein